MSNKFQKTIKGKKSVESLTHFSCGKCQKWWSVGDAPQNKKTWFCPWCGAENGFLPTKKVKK